MYVSNGQEVSWHGVFYELDFLSHLPTRILFLLFTLTACLWVFVWGYISDGVFIFPLPLFFVLLLSRGGCMHGFGFGCGWRLGLPKSLLVLLFLVKLITVDKHGYRQTTRQNDIVVCKVILESHELLRHFILHTLRNFNS
jgi:hypothetical protein